MAQGDLTRIRTNIAALNALNSLKSINNKINVHQLRLATGKRLNQSSDDPAGLTIAKKLDARARSLSQALSNVGEASNVLSIAEGGANNIQELIVQMREKVVQAANDTLGTQERNAIYQQLQELGSEIDQIVSSTTFNNISLLTDSTLLTFQVGASGTEVLTFDVVGNFNSATLAVSNLTVATQALASASLLSIDNALTSVSNLLQTIGARTQRLSVKEISLTTNYTNTEAARSRIEDADLAKEQLEASKYLILQQTATAILAQANVQPQSILSLFQ
ncbi:MAG TPA: flagellin [Methylomirabilota bacterium]|nr:flagellin [Methylomirabilota bacterium]